MFNQLKAAANQFSQSNSNQNQQTTSQQPGVAGQYGGGQAGGAQMQGQQQGGVQQQQQGNGGGDMLDKGIDFLAKKMGRNQSHAETEKYSDMARAQYKKMTGKDMPIADKDYR